MKNIGMLVAVEIQAVLDKFGTKLEELTYCGYTVKKYSTEEYNLYILKCGAGEIAAAAGVQFLITKFDVDLVVNFGVVGGLTPEMAVTHTCIVDKVVHYDFDTSACDDCEVGRYLDQPSLYLPATQQLVEKALEIDPQLKRVICASGDKFIADPKKKEELHKLYGAEICEMEAAAIVLTCNRCKVPCLLIKTVSDSITGGAEEFSKEINRSAALCLDIALRLVETIC